MSDSFDDFQPVTNEWDEFAPANPGPSTRDVMEAVSGIAPEQASEAAKLAKKYNASNEALLATLQDAKLADSINVATEKLNKLPPLAEYMRTRPFVAAQAHKDVDALSGLSEAMNPVERTSRGLLSGLVEPIAPTLRGIGEWLDIAQRRGIQAAASLVLPTPRAGGAPTLESLTGPSMAEGWRAASQGVKTAAQEIKNLPPEQQTFYDSVLSGLGQLPTQIAMSLMTGGASTFAQGTGIMAEKIDKDPNQGQAGRDVALLAGGAITGLTERVTEKLIPRGLRDGAKMNLGAAATTGRVAVAGLSEGAQEFSENVLHDFTRIALVNPDAKVEIKQALEEGGVGAVVGVIARGVVEGALRVRARGTSIGQAEQGAAKLQNMMAAAAASTLRENNPETFAELVQHLADNQEGAPKSIYIDGQVLNQAVQSFTPEQLAQAFPSVTLEQIAQAASTNSTVEVPIGEVMAAVPGTPLEQVFLQNSRSTPDALSLADAQQQGEQAAEFIKQEADRVLQQAQDQAAWQAGSEAVKTTILEQLNQAGRFTPEVNEAYATLQMNFFSTMAARVGLTPQELYDRFSLKVAGASQAAGPVLNAGTKPGEISVEGYHFSKAERPTISTRFFGTGLRGSNRDLYANAADTRLRNRAYFYVDKGTGINPESGVGGIAQRANLSNVYDSDADPLKLKRGADQLAFESAVLDAGFSGYLARMEGTQSGQVILLGDQSVQAEVLGPTTRIPAGQRVPALPRQAPQWQAQASGTPEQLQARLARMQDNPAWADYEMRIEGNELQVRKTGGVLEQSGRAGGDTTFSDRARQLLVSKPIPALSTVDIVDGKADAPAFANITELAAHFTKKNRSKAKDLSDPKTQAKIADAIYAETLHGLTDAGNAIGWYDRKTKAALDIITEVHPELATDEQSRFAFIALLSVTSNGLRSRDNFVIAEQLYRESWKAAGRFPESVPQGGPRAVAMGETLALLNRKVDELGWQAVRDFMAAKHTAKEVRDFAGATSFFGEQATSEVPGALFLGPKLGSFFNNLYGDFSTVTMDRWFMRTMNRVRGRMLSLPSSFGKNLGVLRQQIESGVDTYGVKADKILADIAAFDLMSPEQQGDVLYIRSKLKSLQKYVKARHRDYAKPKDDGTGKKRTYLDRTPENSLAKNLDLAMGGSNDAPFNATDRTWIRSVMDQVQDRLKVDGVDITNADLQAVLWYYEKDLYARLIGGGQDVETETEPQETQEKEAEDYETAARYAVGRLQQQGLVAGSAGSVRPGDAGGRAGGDGTYAQGDLTNGRPEQSGDRGGRYSSGSLAPLEGAPAVAGAAGPDPRLVAVAEQYARDSGIDLRRQDRFVEVDEARAARIAQAYAGMRHAPNDPKVKEAYDDLIRQTRAQYDALVAAGYAFTFFDGTSDPYGGNPWNAMRDLRANQRMSVYGTYAGFGVGAQVNIGLADPKGGDSLDPAAVLQALREVGAETEVSDVFSSDTEPTLVVKIKNALTKEQGDRLSEMLGQEAIAQRTDDEQGQLFGPMAEKWGPYNPAYFITATGDRADAIANPLLRDTGLDWPDQNGEMRPVLANDLFRAVHDAFGHGLEGAGFRARGEENAWQAHVRLFTGPAVGAITSETRGQNSWLNYGPYGEKNRNAAVEDTVFAEQKTGLMPEWTWAEGRAGDMRDDVLEQGPRGTGQADAGLNQSARFSEDNRLSNLNPEGTSWERIREANPALRGKGPDDTVTIYRATVGDTIRPDDFVAVDKSTLRAELKNVRERDGKAAKIIEQQVRVRDLLMGNDATEFVYYPEGRVGDQSEVLTQAADVTQTPEFQGWFGDSKVVDEKGEPLVVYHGTHKPRAKFTKEASFFTSSAANASDYAVDRAMYRGGGKYESMLEPAAQAPGATVQPVFLSIQNPLEVDAGGSNWKYIDFDGKKVSTDYLAEVATDRGYDGLIVKNVIDSIAGRGEPSVTFVALSPTQIKSAIGNDGSFDPANPNILKQGPRGTFNPQTLLITLNENADLSTFLHESGHFFLEVMADLASQPNAPQQIRDDMAAILKWFGIKGEQQDLTQTKAVGPDGNPLLVYHGTEKVFDTFGGGMFTSNRGRAENYAMGSKGRVLEVYLNITNPMPWAEAFGKTPEEIKAAGYDGTIQFGANGEIMRAVVVDPAQVVAPDPTPLEVWNNYTLDQKRQYHERWAESFEQYLFEGKAPSAELQLLFRRFRSWLVNAYKSLTEFMRARDLKVSDEIRQVFDRMLATDEQIRQAEGAAGMLPDFDATNEAIEKLQARSLRDLKWTVNARSKALKALQKEAANLRKAVEAEVRAEVEQQPIYRAMHWLKKGETTDPATGETVKADKGFRLNTAALAEMFPETMLARPDLAGLKGMTSKDGLHPDIVADMFGFADGETLVRSILGVEPMASVIEGMTSQRMLENFGELATPEAIEAAANDAVHNEARARSLATELKGQADALNPRQDTGRTASNGRPITVNALVAAAKEFAENLTARRKVKDLKNAAWQHRSAEARAGKAWQEATAKGKTQEAVQAKRDQVLNNAAVKALQDAQAEVKKIGEFFARVTKGNNEKTVTRGRDPDVVNAARAILAAYDIAPRLEKGALEYLAVLKANDPAMYAALEPSIAGAMNNAKPVGEMTMEELRGLHDEIAAMWHLAKRSRQMEVDGNLLDIEDAADQLQERMQAIGVPLTMPGDTRAITDAEKRGRWLQHAGSLLRRAEQWAEGMDGKFGGPFLRLVFQPVKEAANRYRTDRVKYRKAYQALVDAVAPALSKGPIAAPEIGYTFGEGHNGIGHAELLHAILHTGNESNKRKLLLGRKWATENADGTLDTSRWDAFLQRAHDTGILTKAHYDFAQGVWDLLEQTKPLAQKTHRDVFGRYFAEVTADSFETPFGAYRGGYVPAQADPRLVQDADLRSLAELENESMAYSFPTTNKGFTNARVEYNRPLMLDLRTIGQHIDKVLLFAHMEPAVRDVQKLLSQKGVSYSLGRIDPTIVAGMLTPWLNRSARQIVETPILGDGGISRVLSAARSRAGMALMFGNVSNALQQLSGFANAFAKLKSDGLQSHMMRATAQFISSPKEMSRSVAAASEFMNGRMENEISAINDAMDAILLDPNLYEKAQAWTQKHAYFLQTAFANTMEPIIWAAGYNAALEKGLSEKEAVRYADGLIRQTQGSTLPEDVSRIETGPAYGRIFTQFIGYFNMMANTNATGLKQIASDVGLKKGAGKALLLVTTGMLVPLWIAEAIAQAMRGGPEDEDDDGYLDDWLAAVFGMGTIKGAFAMVPVVGQFANVALNKMNGNPADDRASLSPAVSLLEAGAGVPKLVYQAATDPDKVNARNAVRDVASAISIATGLPAYAVARPLGYAAGVADDKIEPTGAVDAVRGVMTGTPSVESRQR